MLTKYVYRLALGLLSLTLIACATPSMRVKEELINSKRNFEGGLYKTAMRDLLPLAADGNAQAQYAVGYMYYYGYGVTQDTAAGLFWIKRSANQHFEPAIKALHLIATQQTGQVFTSPQYNHK